MQIDAADVPSGGLKVLVECQANSASEQLQVLAAAYKCFSLADGGSSEGEQVIRPVYGYISCW